MNRREFIVGAGTTSAIGVLSGCIGGSSEGNSSENGSGNSSGGNSSGGNSSGNESTVNPKNVIKRVTFEGGKMFVHVGEDVRRVRLYNPNGQKYGTAKVGSGESSAKFTLLKVESGSVVEGYSTGQWKAHGDRKTESGYEGIAWRNLNLQSNVKPTKLRRTDPEPPQNPETILTLKNTGTAPKAVEGARLSAKGHKPSSGTMSMAENPILTPDSTMEVSVGFLGYGEEFELKEGQKPSDVSNEHCNGETLPATLEISGANDETTTLTTQVAFEGKPVQSDIESEFRCSAMSLQSNTSTNSSSNSSTNGS